MLLSKPIRSVREPADGLRVSVMSRHTLNDGVTPDQTIKPWMFDVWQPGLAPPARLLGDYYRRGIDWPEFESRYNDHLTTPYVDEQIRELALQAITENITILCTEESPEICHRRLIVARCVAIEPVLEFDIQ